MKTSIGILIFSIVMASCMNYPCHTYDRSKRPSGAFISAKKSKPVKNRTPYYKLTKLKLAERD